jgi:hypothetical protein
MTRRRAVVTAEGLDALLLALTIASDPDPESDRRAQGDALERLQRAVGALRRLPDLGEGQWNADAYGAMRALHRRAKDIERRLRSSGTRTAPRLVDPSRDEGSAIPGPDPRGPASAASGT